MEHEQEQTTLMGQNMVETIIIMGIVAVLTIIAAFGALFFKKGAAKFSLNPFEQITNFNLMFALLLYAATVPFYLWALKSVDLAIIFPINSLTYVWVSLLSMKFLGEHMNKYKWLGIASIILGVAMISFAVV